MTDKEIIKALECCKKLKYDSWSENKKICEEECPYKANCYDEEKNINMMSEVLDLINRQKAENKELKTGNLILSQKRFNIFERIEFTDKLKKQTKSEAIKEFAERLKDEASEKVGVDEDFLYYDFDDEFKTFDSVADVIKFLSAIVIKEMVGEDK
jgi:hypothetical protein